MSDALDALLWCPDLWSSRGTYKQSHHLGVLYLQKTAQSRGFEVESVLSGHDPQVFAATVQHARPRVVGVSVSGGDKTNLRQALEACRLAKAIDSAIVTVLGGLTPTIFHQEILAKYRQVDLVVRGEGEYAFCDILNGVSPAQIPGLSFRDDSGQVCMAPPRPLMTNLDAIPHAMAMETPATVNTEVAGMLGNIIYERPQRSASLITARGCNGSCTFCTNPVYYKPLRMRSIPHVMDEITALARRGVRFLRICDADFAASLERVMAFCDAIGPMSMRWSCWQRAQMTDRHAFKAMKRAGCQVITFGVESLDPEIRNRHLGKGVSQEELAAATRYASGAGITVTAEVIVGHPAEDRQRIFRGLGAASRILRHVDYVNVSVLSIPPRTALWEQMVPAQPPAIQRRLWLRAMFKTVRIWRLTPSPTAQQLHATAVQYGHWIYRRPSYLARQVWRTVRYRKCIMLLNSGRIARHLAFRIRNRLRLRLSGPGKRRQALKRTGIKAAPHGKVPMDIEVIRSKVKAAIAAKFGLDFCAQEIGDDERIFEFGLGLDSMAAIELIVAIEQAFGIELHDDDLTAENFATIHALSGLVQTKL